MTGYQFKLKDSAEEIEEKTIYLYIDKESQTVHFKLKTPERSYIHKELKLDEDEEEKINVIKECINNGELTSKATNWINKELSGKKYIPVFDPVLEEGIRNILSKYREEFKNLRNKSPGIIEDITIEKNYNKRTHTIDKPVNKNQHVSIFCEVEVGKAYKLLSESHVSTAVIPYDEKNTPGALLAKLGLGGVIRGQDVGTKIEKSNNNDASAETNSDILNLG